MIFFFCNICFSRNHIFEKIIPLGTCIFNPKDIFVKKLFEYGYNNEYSPEILGVNDKGKKVNVIPKDSYLFNYDPEFVKLHKNTIKGVIYTYLSYDIIKLFYLTDDSSIDMPLFTIFNETHFSNINFSLDFLKYSNNTLQQIPNKNIEFYNNDRGEIVFNQIGSIPTPDILLNELHKIDLFEYPYDLALEENRLYLRNLLIISNYLPDFEIPYSKMVSKDTFLTLLIDIKKEQIILKELSTVANGTQQQQKQKLNLIEKIFLNENLQSLSPYDIIMYERQPGTNTLVSIPYTDFLNKKNSIENVHGTRLNSIFI